MAQNTASIKDYSLLGKEAETAISKGLADAQWYTTPIPRDKMKELLTRKDGPAIRDTLLWFALILGSGFLVYLFWGTWYAIFPYIVYSVLYASTSDSRWHEASHGTAFKTDWMNNALYEIASFMVLRQSNVWRWSHARHHSDTIIRGRDPEIAVPTPPNIKQILLIFVGISSAVPELKKLFTHASGRIDPIVATYVPESDFKKVILKARIYVAILLEVIALSIAYGTILPLMFIGLPTLLGSWLMPIYGLTQHVGLQENVLDHRLNCRTVYMNRVHRFLYWNMNYHVEHHMFPLVPYHALPKLHELMKDDCPKPYNGIIETYKEIIPTLIKQIKDPSYYVERKLPISTDNQTHEPDFIDGDINKFKDGKIEICNAEKLGDGDILRFDFNQQTYAIYYTNGYYYATDGMCTHGNTHLSTGVIIDNTIECPKHNGRFTIADGCPKRLPVCVGLKTYKVELINHKLFLTIDNNEREKTPIKSDEITFKVIRNNNVATYIKELVLEIKEPATTYQAGQYAQIIIPPYQLNFKDMEIEMPYKERWETEGIFNLTAANTIYAKRNYSFATNPANTHQLKFNIRLSLPPKGSHANPGIGSSYLFHLKEGDEVKLTMPHGDFLIKETQREMVYIGGGAGMAPLRSHISHLFETEKTKRKVSFWYGARAFNDVFYLDYFKELERANTNFTFVTSLSEPDKNDSWNGEIGFIHEVALRRYLTSHSAPETVEYYLCGPPVLIASTTKMLATLNVPSEMISYDEFS